MRYISAIHTLETYFPPCNYKAVLHHFHHRQTIYCVLFIRSYYILSSISNIQPLLRWKNVLASTLFKLIDWNINSNTVRKRHQALVKKSIQVGIHIYCSRPLPNLQIPFLWGDWTSYWSYIHTPWPHCMQDHDQAILLTPKMDYNLWTKNYTLCDMQCTQSNSYSFIKCAVLIPNKQREKRRGQGAHR